MSFTHSHKEHNHDKNHHHHHAAGDNILVAFLLNLSFAIAELVGGYLSGSVAIMADAVHDFGDSLTLGLSFFLEKVSKKERTLDYTYGFRRVSLLSSVVSGLVICAGSVLVLFHAIPQFWNPQAAPNSLLMIGFSILGITVNGFAALRLKKGSTRNESMLSWHLIEDVLGWVAVLIGAFVIKATGWLWVDPFLACAVALFVIYNVSKSLWTSIEIFLQRKPDGFDENFLKSEIQKLDGVGSIHHVHVWSIDGETNVLSLTIEVTPSFEFNRDSEALRSSIRRIIDHLGPFHTTIEFAKAGQATDTCSL